ncbi:MAG: hypothetical protein ACT4OJ_16600 [Bacteroidota bacterium]
MQKILHSSLFLLLILITAEKAVSQTVSVTGVVYENSMVKIPFSAPQGDIKVYFPDNLTAGARVHGKVVMEPKGKDDKQIAENMNYLQSLAVIPSLSNTGPIITEPKKTVLDETTKKAISDLVFTIPDNADAGLPLKLGLTDDKGPVHFEAEVKVYFDVAASEGQPSNYTNSINPFLNTVSKKVITNSEPLVIELAIGLKNLKDFSFGHEMPDVILRNVLSGSLGSDTDQVEDDPGWAAAEHSLTPWVGSPKQWVLILPPRIAGAFDVYMKYNDGRHFFADRIYVARLKTAIGKNNLQKNETTELSVAVEGLEMCPWSSQIEIENTSVSTVALEKGNRQVYNLNSQQKNAQTAEQPAAVFNMTQQVTGVKPGVFTIGVKLHPPADCFANPLQFQLSAINNPDDFNSWTDALKKDLSSYTQLLPPSANREMINQEINRIAPVKKTDELGRAKAQTLSLLKNLHLPATFTENAQCTRQAYKAACRSVSSTASGKPQPVYWDIIQDGLSLIQQRTEGSELKRKTQEMKELASRLEQGTEEKVMMKKLNENISQINNQDEKENKEVHVEYGKYKSEYLPSGYTHLKGGPEKTLYSPYPMKHIEAGPKESWYVPPSYVHVDSGYDKSNYISPLVRHVAEAGPENSNYVSKDWYHMKTGPSRSYYFPKTIQHIDTGKHKSKLQYWVPGVDKPIREWEFEKKKNSKNGFLQQFMYAGKKAPAGIPDNLFFTNEQFIQQLNGTKHRQDIKFLEVKGNKIKDINNANEVFGYILNQLPEEVTIYPSENYYYFVFGHKGKLYKGSFSLFAHNRDEGIIDIGYTEVAESRWKFSSASVLGGSGTFTAADGFVLDKISDFRYSLSYQERKIIFHLHQKGVEPPAKTRLTAGEIYAGPSFDESGLQFGLVYNSSLQHLYWVLNEDKPKQEAFTPLMDNILLGQRTGFAFYDDKMNNRKILIGVKGENVLQNNWYDGPFDQLPDNYVYTGQLEIKNYLEQSYPGTSGRIDKYGHYLDEKGARIAVAPYLVYFSEEELKHWVKECERITQSAEKCRCLTRQQFELTAGYFK